MEEIPPHPFLTEPVLYVSNLPAHITDEIIARTLEFCVPFRPRLARDPTNGAVTGSIEFRTIERGQHYSDLIRYFQTLMRTWPRRLSPLLMAE
jgi:hypothetical protein